MPQKTPLPGGLFLTSIDPLLVVAVDQFPFGRTTHKPKTFSPVWREEMTSFVQDAQHVEFTIFHKATVPPDRFIANVKVGLDELCGAGSDDLWVSVKLIG